MSGTCLPQAPCATSISCKPPGAPYPTGTSMMMEVADLAEAEALVRTLPMVKAGLARVDIHPLAPFTSLAALFAPAEG